MGTRGVKGTIAKAVLLTLAVAGAVILAAAAPNAIALLKPLIKRMQKTATVDERLLQRAIARLKKRRLVRFVHKGDKTILEITEEGKRRVREFEFEAIKFDAPTRQTWNGRWTIILFDIPEYQKRARDALRRKLKALGCYQYHRSVFVHPSSCGDEIDFLAEFFEISRHVIHFETSTLGTQEHRARKFFHLL